MPLTVILKQITTTYGVKFSYIDDELAGYSLTPPGKNLNLAQTLAYIESNTRLKFEPVNNGNYIIYNTISANNPLCGYLVDAKTGNAIPDALITVAGTSMPVQSDATGYFTVPSIRASIYISHVGYQPRQINAIALYVPACPVFYLEELPIRLEEVVAERYLATGISKKESGQLVVKPQKFGILPGLTEPDVLQTMQQLPGVISIDETVSNINVRGGTHDQNLFLWNGIRMFQTSHFFGLISAFNPLPATTISIYKNGSPAFYGEGVSSVIDISTHGQQDSLYAIFSADMLNANALLNIKLSARDRLQVAARRSFSDLVTTPTFKSYRQRIFQNTTITDVSENQDVAVKSKEDFYFYDVSFSYSHSINNRHNLRVDGIGIKNSLRVYQSTDATQRNDNLTQRSLGGSAALLSNWNESSTSEVQTYVSVYGVNANNESIENEQATHQRNTLLDKGARLKYSYIFSPKISLSSGYQFNEISVRNFDEVNIPAFSKNERVVSRSHAIIGQAGYTSKSSLTKLTAGLRANYFEKFSTGTIEPRVVFNTGLANGFRLEVSAEVKSQAVLQVIDLQQDFLGIEKRRWVLADENAIPLQKSKQASAGLNYSHNGWYGSAEAYYKKVNGITSNSQGFQNQFEFTPGKGYYEVFGAEFLLQKRLGHFYSWLSYTFNDNQYHFNGFVPPQFANNFAIPHAVTAAAVHEWDGWNIALGAKWRSGTPVTEPVSFYIDPENPANSEIIYAAPNNKRLNENFQVNFSLSKTWNLSSRIHFTAGCSVLNILNRKNGINRYYRINKGNNNIESINTYGLRRTPNINVKITF